jgi:hypothetical protein
MFRSRTAGPIAFALLIVFVMAATAYIYGPNGDSPLGKPDHTLEFTNELADGPFAPVEPIDEGTYGEEDPGEKDSAEDHCVQLGLEWDGEQCYQPQLPEETEHRTDEPSLPEPPGFEVTPSPVPPVVTPPNNSCN